MNDKKEAPSSGNDQMLLMIIAAILGCALIQRYVIPMAKAFWIQHNFIIVSFLWLAAVGLPVALAIKIWNGFVDRSEERGITDEDDTAVYLGRDKETSQKISLKQEFRTMHAQVIGTTNAGKSESTVIPMAIQDIKNGSGMLLIDGKAEGKFLDKLYAYIRKYNREDDFRLFSLGNIEASSSFNPLRGESPQQVTERVFSSFTFENEYFRNVQYKYFLGVVRLIFEQKEIPTFALVKQLLSDMETLKIWIEAAKDEDLKRDMTIFSNLSLKERKERVSGLEAAMSDFTAAELGVLFEETDNRIDLDEAMEKGHIIYFQLPTMLYPKMGAATGKLVLQCFQSAIAKRQLKMKGGTGDESDVLLVHS